MMLPVRMFVHKRVDEKLIVSSYRQLSLHHTLLAAQDLYDIGTILYAPWLFSHITAWGALKKMIEKGGNTQMPESVPLYIYEDDPLLNSASPPAEVILKQLY